MAAGGYLQLMQRGMVPAADMQVIIDTITRNVHQITSLVNDILFLQEMDLILPKFQAVDMRQVAQVVAEKYQEKAKIKNITLSLLWPHQLPLISGDAKSLERAMTAIVDNAVKFTGEGKKITIDLGQENNHIVVKVIDEGVGIDPEIRPHIFDRFYHLERIGEELFRGIGVGLAITRQVIEQHNGKLEVESEPGQGTTFTIRLNIMRVAL
jgi:two-component system, OmpR family, sensor kinase